MKKIISILIAVIMLISATIICSAATDDYREPDVSVNYITTKGGIGSYIISSSGMATMEAFFPPRVIGIVDKVDVNFVVKNSQGKVVLNKTVACKWSNEIKKYVGTYKAQLPQSDVYIFAATFYCYRNGIFIETVGTDTVRKGY